MLKNIERAYLYIIYITKSTLIFNPLFMLYLLLLSCLNNDRYKVFNISKDTHI